MNNKKKKSIKQIKKAKQIITSRIILLFIII